tara:strand:+ start:3209 stop:3319 length:111 start_codon:yes stop_codon:yes gene_type:complete
MILIADERNVTVLLVLYRKEVYMIQEMDHTRELLVD